MMRYILCALLVATAAGESSLQVATPTDLVCEDGSTININQFFSTGERKAMEGVLEPNFEDWKTMLVEAPVAINLITNMIIISASITDETLEEYEPVHGWQYTRHPTSLRACLVQLGNDAWDAFEGAHRNMDEIQLNMLLVPAKVQNILGMLANFPLNLLKITLPRTLDEIDDIATHCANKANDSYNVFKQVNGYIGELNEVVSAADGGSEIKLRRELINLNAAGELLQGTQKVAHFAEKDLDRAEQLIDEQRAKYNEAVDQIPSSSKLLRHWVVRTVVRGAMAYATGGLSELANRVGEGGGPGSFSNSASIPGAQIMDMMILDMMNNFNFPAQLDQLEQVIDNPDESTAKDLENWEMKMTAIKTMLPNKTKTMIKDMATKLLNEVAMQWNLLKTGGLSNGTKQQIRAKLDDLKMRFTEFRAIQPQTFKPPAAETINQPNFKTPEAQKAYILSQELKALQESYDRKVETMIELKLSLAEMQAKIASIDLTVADLKEVRQLLQQVLELLGQIKKSWSKLVLYFQMVANRVKIVNKVMVTFIDDVTDAMIDDEARNLMESVIKEGALKVNFKAYYLYTVAHTYVNISKTYLMDNLAGQVALLGNRSAEELNERKSEVDKDTTDARKGIETVITQAEQQYTDKIIEAQIKMHTYIACLGGVTPAVAAEQLDKGIKDRHLIGTSIAASGGVVPVGAIIGCTAVGLSLLLLVIGLMFYKRNQRRNKYNLFGAPAGAKEASADQRDHIFMTTWKVMKNMV